MDSKIKVLAYYLPQFHPIPENDEWWGKGFTEWTNVAKAKPLFKGHVQPKLPADLGFYDLRLAEAREAQAKMACENGIHGFIYYHYWFGNGKHLLKQPLNEVLENQKPDFPFCICWANETWSGIWHGTPNKILVKQEYPGYEDLEQHFNYLLKAFQDSRYIKIDGKPVFVIYDGQGIPGVKKYLEMLRALATKHGLPGLYIMASNKNHDDWDYVGDGFDGKISGSFGKAFHATINNAEKLSLKTILPRAINKIRKGTIKKNVTRIDHRQVIARVHYDEALKDLYPLVQPNWDNTPRSGRRGVVLENSSPELLQTQIDNATNYLKSRKDLSDNFIVLKSWNEWAEGNHIEPDNYHGYEYLDVFRRNFT